MMPSETSLIAGDDPLTRRRWLSDAVASLGAAAFASAVSAKPGQSSANNLAAIKGRLPSTTKLIEEGGGQWRRRAILSFARRQSDRRCRLGQNNLAARLTRRQRW